MRRYRLQKVPLVQHIWSLFLTLLDLGAAPQGANTVQPLTLSNSGGGIITWTMSSNQPWLMISPTQGRFGDQQTISVGGERANLKPGDYQGVITFSSNVGNPQTVQVQMTVRPVSLDAGPVLSLAPAVLSFTAIDNGAEPAAQFLVINNPGSQSLSWSVTSSSAQSVSGLSSTGTNFNWLSTDHTSGVVVPRSTALVRVIAHSRNLLPGAYTSTLVFTGADGAINSPQSVNVSLTVQQRCSLMVSTGSMSFTAVAGQGNPGNQVLNVKCYLELSK